MAVTLNEPNFIFRLPALFEIPQLLSSYCYPQPPPNANMASDLNDASIDTYLQVLSPLIPIFSYNQLETLLCAWVPHRLDGVLERHGLKSGLYVVDHFIVTATIALLIVSTKMIVTYITHHFSRKPIPDGKGNQSISVTIHPSITDSYHNSQ
jgi:hypothetical protein